MDAPIEVHPGIFIAENFLSQEEVALILNYCSTLTTEDWNKRGDESPNISSIGLSSAVLDRLRTLFDPSEYIVRNANRIQRREPGEHDVVHYAHLREDDRCLMSCLIIVNDDYEGGELDFVNQEFVVKPKSGSIIYFSPTEDHAFNIRAINEGSFRYAIPEDIFVIEPDQPTLEPINS
jgi:hypothetical protein